MKIENDLNSSDFDESNELDVMDALLHEHARLGEEEDTALVNSILLRTVNKPADLPQHVERARFSWQEWGKLAAIVALFIGLTGFLLREIPGIGGIGGLAGNSKRDESTFQLTITYTQPENSNGSILAENSTPPKNGVVRDTGNVLAAGSPVGSPDTFPLNSLATITLIETDSNALAGTFAPSADLFNATTGNRTESFAISADRATRSSDLLEYVGKVEVNHPEFQIHADRLVVQAGEKNDPENAGAFQAYGATIERTLENGKVEVASADYLVYEPAAQLLVLSGRDMKLTTTGSDTLHFSAGDEKLILHRDGYQVIRN